MKMKTSLLAGAVASIGLAASVAIAQTGPQEPDQLWGIPVSANESSEAIRTLGDQLGMVRSNQLYWQQLNAIEFTANGRWAELESGSNGKMPPVSQNPHSAPNTRTHH